VDQEVCPELVDSLEEPLPVLDLVETMDLPSRKSIKSLDPLSLSLSRSLASSVSFYYTRIF